MTKSLGTSKQVLQMNGKTYRSLIYKGLNTSYVLLVRNDCYDPNYLKFYLSKSK